MEHMEQGYAGSPNFGPSSGSDPSPYGSPSLSQKSLAPGDAGSMLDEHLGQIRAIDNHIADLRQQRSEHVSKAQDLHKMVSGEVDRVASTQHDRTPPVPEGRG